MKWKISARTKRLGIIIAVTCVLAFCLLQVVGAVFNVPEVSVFAQMSNAEKYAARNQRITDAMAYVGVDTAEQAAKVWAQGVKLGNAAMQFAVMSSELRESYAAQLEKTAPNWSTNAVGSIIGFSIDDVKTQGSTNTITLTFTTTADKGEAKRYTAKLTIEPEEDFYRITSIEADEGLGAYIGL